MGGSSANQGVSPAWRGDSTLPDGAFSLRIIYEPSEVEIVLIAVAHLHRNPEYWRSRVQ